MNNKETTDFLKYIDENIKNGEDVSNEKLAEILGYEQHYLARKFREHFGNTIQEYVVKRKMIFASYDLLKTKEKIVDIAIKYGYSTDGFTKAFKKIYKKTPSQYRINRYNKIECEEITEEDVISLPLKIDSCQISNKEQLKFIGMSVNSSEFNIEFCIKCSNLLENFKLLSLLEGNEKFYQITYNSKGKNEYMVANFYNPLDNFSNKYEIKSISKQKWLIISGHSINFRESIYDFKNYVLKLWLPIHKEYELDDNYEIAFEKNNYDYDNLSDFEKNTSRVEVWIPIRKKKRI